MTLCTVGGAAATTTPPITLPDKPDSAGVKSAFPSCSFVQSLAVLTKCSSDIELFRLTLEDFNGSLADYIVDLKRSDTKLETLRAKGRIEAADYEDFHDQIATELGHASQKTGKYLKFYYNNVVRYKQQSGEIKTALERCRVMLACRSASAS